MDVVDTKGGITRQNLILAGALGKAVEDHRDRNSGACCTDLTAADLWVTAEKILPCRHISSLRGRHADVHSPLRHFATRTGSGRRLCLDPPYSHRNALIGSMAVARRAGR